LKDSVSKSRRLYDFFTKRWYLSTIFFTLSSQWFILLQFFGKKWGIIDDVSGGFKPYGIVITVVFVLSTFIFTIIKTLADVKNEEGKFRGQTMLNQLLEEINASKLMKLTKYIDYATDTNVSEFINIITPEQQIKELFNNLLSTISSLFGIDKSKIGISIAYNYNNTWQWLYTLQITNDLKLEQLISNPNTSLYQIISGRTPVIFWADKKDGIEQQQYVSGEVDKTNNNAGSIYCADISIRKNENIILPAVVTLTTYGQMLCLPNDNKTIDYIKSMIMPAFNIRFQLELCLFYIRKALLR
jgi:hypothetical protein